MEIAVRFGKNEGRNMKERTWEAAKIKKIEIAISEAHRFIQKAAGWKRRLSSDEGVYVFSSKEGGAAKRASMDLSRSLTDLRKT